MKNRLWIVLILVIALAALVYFVYRPALVTGTTGTSTSTGFYGATAGTEQDLTVAGVTSAIVGIWQSSNPSASFTFSQNGTFNGKVGTWCPESGTWALFTSTTPPTDLASLSLEPDHVFLRLTMGNTHEDYFLWRADATGLSMGPLGQGGSITFTRVK